MTIRPIRSRPAGALLLLAVLLGLLGWGAAVSQRGAEQPSRQGLAAAPLHAGELVPRDPDPAQRALGERGRRQGPARTGGLAALLAGALALAGLGSRSAARRPAGAARPRGRPRRTWSRAPPRHLQPA
jgi:hypothetical protein